MIGLDNLINVHYTLGQVSEFLKNYIKNLKKNV